MQPTRHCPLCPENEILTRFGPGVSTSDTLSDSSSALRFLETFLFLFPIWVEMRGSSGTVGVEAAVIGVADSSCWSCFIPPSQISHPFPSINFQEKGADAYLCSVRERREREDAVRVVEVCLSSRDAAFDVVVEAFNNVSVLRLLEVGRLCLVYVIFVKSLNPTVSIRRNGIGTVHSRAAYRDGASGGSSSTPSAKPQQPSHTREQAVAYYEKVRKQLREMILQKRHHDIADCRRRTGGG